MRRSFPVGVGFAITHPWSRQAGDRSGRPAALDVHRASTGAEVGQSRLDPTGGEVGAAFAYLLHRGELGVTDFAWLLTDPVGDGGVVLATVEDQAYGVVPSTPGRQPVGQEELSCLQLQRQLLLHLAGRGELR